MSTVANIKQQIKICELAIADSKRVIEGYQKQTVLVTATINAKARELLALKKDLKLLEPEVVA